MILIRTLIALITPIRAVILQLISQLASLVVVQLARLVVLWCS